MKPKISANNALGPPLELFRDFLSTRIEDGINFKPGETIQFGWSWFRIDNVDDELVVKAPEDGTMPMNFILDCSSALNIVARQRYTCDSFGQPMEGCNSRQTAIVVSDIVECKNLFLNRTDSESGSTSGWYLGAQDSKADMNNAEDFELKSLWELSCLFPMITEFLLLPRNWQVVFNEIPIALYDFKEVECKIDSYYHKKYKS